MDRTERPEEEGREEPMWRGWAIVWGLALAFLLYGLLMFVIVGDKGPPDWDFNVVEDIPGKSIYSTHPEPVGNAGEPDPQHVSGKPALAPGNGGEGKK